MPVPVRLARKMRWPDHRSPSRSDPSPDPDRSYRPSHPLPRSPLAFQHSLVYQSAFPALVSSHSLSLPHCPPFNYPNPLPSLSPGFSASPHSNSTNQQAVYRTGYVAALEFSSSVNGFNNTRSSVLRPSAQPYSSNHKSSAPHCANTLQERFADDLSADMLARLRLNSSHPSIPTAHQRGPWPGPHSAPRRPLHTESMRAQDPVVGVATEQAPVLSAARRRNLARARRDEDLRSRLPPFELHDPAFGAQIVELCPSAEHPESELAGLIEVVCADGIKLSDDSSEPGRVAIAFDMEWVMSRVRGHENRTALVQLAGQSRTLLIQLSQISLWRRKGVMPEALGELLRDRRVVKLGVGIRNDGLKLLRDHKFGPKPFLNSYLELSFLVRAIETVEMAEASKLISLQRIVGEYLDVYLPKNDVRMSDWSRGLSESQVDYAASDVVATIRVTQRLIGLLSERQSSNTLGTQVSELLGSLEPGMPEPQVPVCRISQPVLVVGPEILNEWIGLKSFAGDDRVDQECTHDNGKIEKDSPTSTATNGEGNNFKRNESVRFAVTPRTREAWELWYEQEGSIEAVSNKMGIKPISVAIYVSKMMIMKRRQQVAEKEEGGFKKLEGIEKERSGCNGEKEAIGECEMMLNGKKSPQEVKLEQRFKVEVLNKFGICRRMGLELSEFGLE